MKRYSPLLIATAITAVWLAGTGTATGQAPRATTQLETVTVVAPRITYERARREGGSAVPSRTEVIKQTAVVDASDLDLSRTADMYALETRVERAAQRVCTELAASHPEGKPDTPVCMRRAVEDAMAQVRQSTRQLAGN